MAKTFVDVISNFQSVKKINRSAAWFAFSLYKNGLPGTGVTQERKVIRNKVISLEFLLSQMSNLDFGWEIAFNSNLDVGNITYHLPLIDFSSREIDSMVLSSLNSLKSEYGGNIYVYDSGRSYHGYHDILLTEHEWQKYLGTLLLFNRKEFRSDVIDSRWIGHSLKQGYSSLRISCNTIAYIKIPEFLFEI